MSVHPSTQEDFEAAAHCVVATQALPAGARDNIRTYRIEGVHALRIVRSGNRLDIIDISVSDFFRWMYRIFTAMLIPSFVCFVLFADILVWIVSFSVIIVLWLEISLGVALKGYQRVSLQILAEPRRLQLAKWHTSLRTIPITFLQVCCMTVATVRDQACKTPQSFSSANVLREFSDSGNLEVEIVITTDDDGSGSIIYYYNVTIKAGSERSKLFKSTDKALAEWVLRKVLAYVKDMQPAAELGNV